jgi:hypothetical protein
MKLSFTLLLTCLAAASAYSPSTPINNIINGTE